MREIKILHTADLHLDSAFEGLPAGKASIRRSEQRSLLRRIAELARSEAVDLVLMSGDLLDSDSTYFETGEELIRSLSRIDAPVFIAPGNHDYYSAKSPYARLKLPRNVHVFKSPVIECVSLPELGVKVYGAAFTEKSSGAMLEGFTAEKSDDTLNIMCIHGEVGTKDSAYDPISEDAIAHSGMDYIALGHIHKAGGLRRAGETWYSWPGCPEGRGFDETGAKTVSIVTLSRESCRLDALRSSQREYEILKVDVTGTDPLLAIHTALPDDTVSDIYRIIMTGEVEVTPDLNRYRGNLSDMFFELQLRDETHLRRSVWESAGEDTLRGIFLTKLKQRYDSAKSDEERREIEQAARWGIAALDNREEVLTHEDQ